MPVSPPVPEKVYVAVGKSVQKGVSLLDWTLSRFKGREICILHVHQPSPFIPTLLGKLPASQGDSDVVSAYRRVEKDKMNDLLLTYLSICTSAKVKASIITCENDHVRKGIVDLVNEHGVRELVMGGVPDTWMKVKKSSSKASYTAKNAPSFCQMWFVNKGKLLRTRGASSDNLNSSSSAFENEPQIQRSRSVHFDARENESRCEHLRTNSTRILPAANGGTLPVSSNAEGSEGYVRSLSRPSITSSVSGYFSSSDSEESLFTQLAELHTEAEASISGSLAELTKRKKAEAQALEFFGRVKTYEFAYAKEVTLRKKAEDELRTLMQEQEQLVKETEAMTKVLQKVMRNIAILDSRLQESNRRREEAAEELILVQSSIMNLTHEKQKIQSQKMEATRWLSRWRNCREVTSLVTTESTGSSEAGVDLAEFSLSDLEAATCDFSESFMIGQGGFGCVYKGEMLGRTVAIKRLHHQGQSEFYQEVQVLGKLQHPHLVKLIGICSEASALIYEYMPNSCLRTCLFRRSNSLNWKTRTRFIYEIASALLFLHWSRPKIIHGNLKPENILLDANLNCKICDFRICRIVNNEMLWWPSFQQDTEPNGAFSYMDPEFSSTGRLTIKSDVYSFGLIVLQLLTGRGASGLAMKVGRAVSRMELVSILDSSAGEWPTVVARRLVDLGLQCCEVNGRDRPLLTPRLVRELEQLHCLEERVVPSFFLCPILHLHLTPNHSLRLAIQDWLCSS